jgi:hypothetical protein
VTRFAFSTEGVSEARPYPRGRPGRYRVLRVEVAVEVVGGTVPHSACTRGYTWEDESASWWGTFLLDDVDTGIVSFCSFRVLG